MATGTATFEVVVALVRPAAAGPPPGLPEPSAKSASRASSPATGPSIPIWEDDCSATTVPTSATAVHSVQALSTSAPSGSRSPPRPSTSTLSRKPSHPTPLRREIVYGGTPYKGIAYGGPHIKVPHLPCRECAPSHTSGSSEESQPSPVALRLPFVARRWPRPPPPPLSRWHPELVTEPLPVWLWPGRQQGRRPP